MKHYSIHEFSKLIVRTPQTLRNWYNSGRLKPNHTGANKARKMIQELVEESEVITNDNS